MRARHALVVLAAALAVPAHAHGYSRPAEYGIHQVKDLTVRMSDGVELAADVYYPADPTTGEPRPGPFPVVLSQTPYAKRSFVTTQSFGEFGGDGYFPYLYEVRRGGAAGSFVNLPLADPGRLATSRRSFGECNSQC